MVNRKNLRGKRENFAISLIKEDTGAKSLISMSLNYKGKFLSLNFSLSLSLEILMGNLGKNFSKAFKGKLNKKLSSPILFELSEEVPNRPT